MMKKELPRKTFQAGIVDVGAHSVRLDIFEVSPKRGIVLLESLARTINLGYDVFRRGAVSPENLSRLADVMRDFARKLDEYGITLRRVVATSAIREAFNRELVVNRLRHEAGFDLEILESQEEVKIAFSATREAVSAMSDFKKLSGICLLIGSGSLMFSYFENGLMRFSEEIPLGTARLFDSFGRSAFSIDQVLETLHSQDVGRRLAECVDLDPARPLALIAGGASVRAFAAIAGGDDAPPAENECVVLDFAAAIPLLKRMMYSEPETLAREFALSAEHASSLGACAAILHYFLETFNIDSFLCPGLTTRTALIQDLVRSRVEEKDSFRDDVLAVCDAAGHKYGYDPEHARQVVDICRTLLHKLARDFDFTPRAELLLEAAARLHDVGRFVDPRHHHKHSWYLIGNLEVPGISRAELRVIAAVARYHRGSLPRESHPEFTMLSDEDKVTTLKLAAILRAADALDCQRRGSFDRLKPVLRGHTLVLQVPESGELRMERFYLEQKGSLFNQVFGLELKIEEIPLSL